MKTQNVHYKLKFEKNSLVELNENQLYNVQGGASTTLIGTTSLVIISIATQY